MDYMNTSYSQTPLAKKLGIKEGYSILIINRPPHYFKLFSDLPKNLDILKGAKEGEVDFIHLFVKTKEELEDRIIHVKPLIKKEGIIWVSWPKKSSELISDLKRDYIREFILGIGLIDVKVCSIDQDWSALKFVYRLQDR